MEYALLRTLRALGPGLILLTYFDAFRILALSMDAYFWSLDTSKLLLVGYIVGGAYGALTVHVNRESRAFSGINESTLQALEIIMPGISQRHWNEVAPCFYMLVDADKSLEQKSKGMYFNGFIVTTAFEALWISYGAAVLGIGVLIWLGTPAFLGLAVLAAGVSWLVWRASVKRHAQLAASQVNVIRQRFRSSFVQCIEEGRDRSAEKNC